MVNYKTVSIPADLVEKISNVIDNEHLGYTSVSEFIKEAIRKQLTKVRID